MGDVDDAKAAAEQGVEKAEAEQPAEGENLLEKAEEEGESLLDKAKDVFHRE